MMDHVHEFHGTAGRASAADPFDLCSGQAAPPLHRFAELMHHKRLMMRAKSMEMNVRLKAWPSQSLPAVAGIRCSGEAPKQGRRGDRCPDLHRHGDVVTDDFLCCWHGIEHCM